MARFPTLSTVSRGDIDRVMRLLTEAEREAREARDFRRSQAAYGIGWAIETARVGFDVAAMVAADTEAVLAAAAAECDTIADVPGWLHQAAA